MAGSILGRCLKTVAGACLTLLAIGVGAPRAIEAGCVHDRPSVTHFEHLARAGAFSGASEHETKAMPAKAPTCDGPSCVKPPVVPAAPSWTVPNAQDSWAVLAGALAPAPCPVSALAPETAEAAPEAPGSSIFHPPQIATS